MSEGLALLAKIPPQRNNTHNSNSTPADQAIKPVFPPVFPNGLLSANRATFDALLAHASRAGADRAGGAPAFASSQTPQQLTQFVPLNSANTVTSALVAQAQAQGSPLSGPNGSSSLGSASANAKSTDKQKSRPASNRKR